MWSFNRDGEAGEHLKRDFQQHMAIDEAGKRPHRQAFAELAHPQHGVDAMAGQFTGTTPLAAVVDAAASG